MRHRIASNDGEAGERASRSVIDPLTACAKRSELHKLRWLT